MSFIEKLMKSKSLVKQAASESERADLFGIVERDLKDSKASVCLMIGNMELRIMLP